MGVGHFLRAHSVLKSEEGSVVHRGRRGGGGAQKRCQVRWRYPGRDGEFSTAERAGRRRVQHHGQCLHLGAASQGRADAGGHDVIPSLNTV